MSAIVITGPCLLKWNSVNFFSKGDVKVEFSRTLFDINTDQHGLVDSRHKSAVIKVTFTPCGRYDEISALLAWCTGKSPGQSLVPQGAGNEKSLVIQPLTNAGGASKIWTFLRAGPTAIGNIMLSATKTMAGAVTFTCLVSTVTANTFFTTATYAAPSGTDIDDFTQANIPTMACEAVWGDVPGTLVSGDLVMTSMDGWTLDVGLKVKEHEREAMGIADITLTDVTPTCSGEAANIYDYLGALLLETSWAGLMPFQTALPGQTATRKKLTLRTLANDGTGGSTVFPSGTVLATFPKAELTAQTLAWAAEGNRTGQVAFKSIPTFASGVRDALMTLPFS